MAKIGIDKDAIKRFFSLHVEKIVLGVVVVLLVLFIYRGYSLEGLASAKRPDALKTEAAAVRTYIDNPAVEKEIVEENKQETEFVARTKAGQAPIVVPGYSIALTHSTLKPSGRPRTDPDVFPPLEVEAVPISAAIAYIPARGEVDPFKDDENMEPKKAEEPKKKRPTRRGRDRKDDMAGGPGGFPGMAGPGESGLGGLGGLGTPGPSEDQDEGTMSSMSGMGGLGTPGGVIMANPADIEGFRPPAGAIVISKHIVGVTALVPYKKQWDEFDAKLSNAMAYTKSRDVPKYLGFYAERTEVTDEDDTDFKWKPISSSDFVVKQMTDGRRPYGGWAGYPQEIADPRYVAPNILTMPIPPVVSKSYDAIALHSKVPRYQVMAETTEGDETTDEPDEPDAAGDIGRAPSLGGVGPGAGFDGEGGPGMPGMPGMSGYGAQGTGAPGGLAAPGMGAPGMGAPGMGAGMGASGMQGMGGYGAGGDEGYGAMGGMGGMGDTPTFGPSVDYLMVRFFDLSIRDATKKYRYRVQLWVEDPNHPKNPLADPNVRALSPEVRARITDIKAKETAAKNRLAYFRTTEFSEPSGLISFEQTSQTLGGAIAMERETVVVDPLGNRFKLPYAERTAKVMSVVWDANRAIEVPGLVDAYRGTFLNFVLNADVVHPVSLQYKTIKDFPFKTNRMVLDFMGGEPLPVPKDEQEDNPLFAPAEFLFLNEKGELFVKNELDDWDGFKKRLPPEIPAADDPLGGPDMFGPEGGEGPGGLPPGIGGPGEDPGDYGAPGRGGGRSGRGGV